MSFGQVLFYKICTLYLPEPEWASGDKNLYVAPCIHVPAFEISNFLK